MSINLVIMMHSVPTVYGKKIHIVPKFHAHVQGLSIFVAIIHLFFKWLYILKSYNMVLV